MEKREGGGNRLVLSAVIAVKEDVHRGSQLNL